MEEERLVFGGVVIDRALSIRQPWAWAILRAGKDVENRSWGTAWRGEFYIHAAKNVGKRELEDAISGIVEINPAAYDLWPGRDRIELGGIVGVARLVDCRLNRYEAPKSLWETPENFGLVLADVRPLPFVPCKGALGFWKVPADVQARIREAA